MSVNVTWLGHATFLIETDKGTILVDPWLSTNPKCPEAYYNVEPDAIVVTHGHFDHIADLVNVAQKTEGPVVGIFELTSWVGTKGIDESRLVGMNIGGTVRLDNLGLSLTMVEARHSSSFTEESGVNVYLGEAAGYVLNFDNGPKVYLAGDTALFGDMEWIARLHQPEVAILPIGDRFTMDPKAAAWACQLLGVKSVVPCHYGTFPLLTGTPEELEKELEGLELNVNMRAT